METGFSKRTLDLADASLLALRDGKGTRILCLLGALWITEEGDTKDTILGDGESCTLSRAGLAIVTALGASRIRIEAPPRLQHDSHRRASGDVPELASCT
jgi:hypothetical protein